jgi:hypothetical protein
MGNSFLSTSMNQDSCNEAEEESYDQNYVYSDDKSNDEEEELFNSSSFLKPSDIIKGCKGKLLSKHVHPRTKKCNTDYYHKFGCLIVGHEKGKVLVARYLKLNSGDAQKKGGYG